MGASKITAYLVYLLHFTMCETKMANGKGNSKKEKKNRKPIY